MATRWGRAAQVRDHLLGRGKGWLGIDDPGVLLQRGDEAGKSLGVGQGSRGTREAQDLLGVGPLEAREILAAQDLGQAFDWEEEVAALRGNPARAVWDQGATGDDPVDVDVVLERLPPGMEHQGQADLTAEPPGITAKGLQGGGGALEEEAVEPLGVALGQGVERVRQGQDTMEIGNV